MAKPKRNKSASKRTAKAKTKKKTVVKAVLRTKQPRAKAARKAKAKSAKPRKASGAKKDKAVARPRTTLPSPGVETDGGLSAGSRVPSFELPDQDGNVVSSSSLEGEPYVLYFYPKDDTPGCTKEACGFRDDIGKFRAKGVRIIGVSPDKPESHVRFRDKYGLNFTLLSDVDKKLIQACGVWVKKQNYGREYMGVERSTFLVGGDGTVRKVWRRVRVDGHVGAILESA
jgi:peroxiredoxin Q/BCP